jgi:hypothetical protein
MIRLLAIVTLALAGVLPRPACAASEAMNMRLVGMHTLEGGSTYQPTIKRQNGRYILYTAHHAGGDNGTSILDVTDPSKPALLAHIPAAGGAQHARVCRGDELPNADRTKTYLLRTRGNTAHELWDVTDPSHPEKLTTIIDGLGGTHKNWWSCDTGIAYLNANLKRDGWSTSRGLKI